MSCSILEVKSPIVVTANIQRWTITSDDIYLLQFQEEPPQWLEDLFDNMLNDSGLVDEVADLDDRFTNFEEGYYEHVYDWVEGDEETRVWISNLYTTNTVFNAGIQEIKSTYVSNDGASAYFDTLIGAWQTGAGGAWFNERVSTVSTVAYAAAKSASTLTATLSSQQDRLDFIAGDLDALEKQVDGVVETFFGTWDVINTSGNLILTAEPYATWVAEDTLDLHTGDTYVKYELDAYGNQVYINSQRFAKTTVNVPQTDANGYAFIAITDSRAEEAYQLALDAQITADGKINTFFLPYPPTDLDSPDGTVGEGDLWIDSDDGNKMYRYDGTDPFSTSGWIAVRDTDITASVQRLDEATVDVDGTATAKGSLVVNADGNISGYRASATNDPNDPGSSFQIYADKFYVGSSVEQAFSTAPFSIDTTLNPSRIKFNGLVTFSNITTETGEPPNWLFAGEAAADINQNTTTIDGGKITTFSLNANRIAVDTLWARGMIASEEQRSNITGFIPNEDPAGFLINGTADEGSFNYPNIYGSYIRGGTIYGTHMEAMTIKASDFIFQTDDGKNARITVVADDNGGSYDLYPFDSVEGGTDNQQRIASKSGIPASILNQKISNYTFGGAGTQPNYAGTQARIVVGASVLATVSFDYTDTNNVTATTNGITFKLWSTVGVGYGFSVYHASIEDDFIFQNITGEGNIRFEIYINAYGTWQWFSLVRSRMIVYNK